jgi:hypothetical protein
MTDEERAAWDRLREQGYGASAAGGPTDDFHDHVVEMRELESDVRDSILRYKCARCGGHSPGGGQLTCRNVVCDQCARVPPRDRLPELDVLSRLRQTPQA